MSPWLHYTYHTSYHTYDTYYTYYVPVAAGAFTLSFGPTPMFYAGVDSMVDCASLLPTRWSPSRRRSAEGVSESKTAMPSSMQAVAREARDILWCSSFFSVLEFGPKLEPTLFFTLINLHGQFKYIPLCIRGCCSVDRVEAMDRPEHCSAFSTQDCVRSCHGQSAT